MKISKTLIGIALSSLLASATVFAQSSVGLNDTQKKEMEGVVHDYIVKNPDVLVQSLQSYQQKQMEQTQQSFKKIQEMAPKFSEQIFRQAADPIAGNPNGKVTLVEFSDYQCAHCIDMAVVVDNLIKKNPNLRVVLKEFPIRGPASEASARAALAAQKQGKYFEFHNALMLSKKEPLNEATIFDIAKSVGLDVGKLKTDMKSSDVSQQIKTNYKLAQDLQLMFTPVFFIAKTDINKNSGPDSVIFIPGGVGEDQLAEAISKIGS